MSIKPRCGTAARSPCSVILHRIASHCVERLREEHRYCKLCLSNQIKVFHNSIHLVGVGVCMHRNVRVRTDLGFGVEMWPAGPGRMVRQWSDGYMPYVGGRASERRRAARTNHYYSFFLILTNEVPCTHHGKPTISSTQRGIAGPPSTNRVPKQEGSVDRYSKWP